MAGTNKITGDLFTKGSSSHCTIYQDWLSGAGTWLDLSTDGPSAIGTGGSGVNPMIAYCSGGGQFFTDILTNDYAIRNVSGAIRFGNTSGAASVVLDDDQLTARLKSRILTFTSDATPAINTDLYDAVTITALATAITSMTTDLSGTPNNFQKLIIRIKDNATIRAIAWGSDFEDAGKALPTTTVASKLLTVAFIYNTVTSKWGCVGVANET